MGANKGDTVKYLPIQDVAVNDSNKDITIANLGKYDYQLLWLHVDYTATATAGNRLLELELLDPNGDSCGHIHPGSYQAENLNYHYYFLPGIFRETVSAVAESGVDGTIQVPVPAKLIVPAGYTLNIRDANAVDVAADDMLLHGMVEVLR
jgi:hypothetical protein